MQGFKPFLSFAILATFLFFCIPAAADPGACMPGRAVVNWLPPFSDRIQDYLEGKATLQDALGGPSVERVFAKYGVGKMERLFRDVDLAIRNRGPLPVRAAYDAFQAGIRARFPERQARAPEGAAHIPTYGIFVLEFDPTVPPREVCEALLATGRFLWAEPDPVIRLQYVPVGQNWGSLWGIQKIGCATAWDSARGAGVVVAVIDTGINFGHEDLAGQNWINPGEIAGNSIDDDGNGLVDDTVGWDYVNNDNNPTDDHGHGSHCSGTVAATDNTVGVIGIAFNAKLMSLKGLSASGSGGTSLQNCLNYAINKGADVLSNSWGGAGWWASVNTIVSNAVAAGAVPVFAAGNSNQDGTLFEPANCAQSFTVSACNSAEGRASFSVYGVKSDVTAPGVNILSVAYAGGYTSWQGTSMACPHVSGSMAVLISELAARGLGSTSVEQMRQILRSRAADKEAAGWDEREAHGRLDLAAMMGVDAGRVCEAKIVTPDASAAVAGSSVTFTGYAWAPTGRFQDYVLEYAPGLPYDSASWTAISSGASPVRNGTLGTLNLAGVPDGRYTARLTVRNDQGAAFRDRVDFVADAVSDNAVASAVPVIGSPLTHTVIFDRNLAPSLDQDWFSFQAVAGTAYEFRTSMLSGNADTVLTLYQANGTTWIADNDDFSGSSPYLESRIQWTCVTSGTYTLRVTNTMTGVTGSYRLACKGLFVDGAEPDGSAATAKSIPVNGSAAHRSIAPAGDVDWVRFDAQAGRTYTLEASKASAASAMTLELYGTDGSTLLRTGTVQADGRVAVTAWSCPADGTYFAKTSTGAAACGHYLVRVYEKQDVLYDETFGVVGAALWSPTSGTWAVASGEYACTDTAAASHHTHAGPAGWGSLVADAKLRLASTLTDPAANNGVLLWGDDSNYVMARIRRDDFVEIVQMENGTQAVLAIVARTVNDDTDYRIRAVFEGGNAVIEVDGTVVASVQSFRFPAGRLGLRSFGCRGVFDDLRLWRPGPGSLVDFSLTTTALPPGMQNRPYSRTLAAAGGTQPYAFAALGGTAPPGLALSSAGVLSGTPTSAGTFAIQVSVLDASLRLRAGVVSLTIVPVTAGDILPPTVTFVNPLNGTEVGTNDQILRVDVTDVSAVDTVQARVNGGSWAPLVWTGGIRWEGPLVLAEGANLVEVQAKDYVPNVGISSIGVDLDTTPPVVTLGTWKDGMLSLHPSITLDGLALDAVSVTVNGAAAASFDAGTGAWTAPVTLAIYGENLFTVRATDVYGRWAEVACRIHFRLKGDVDGDGDVDDDDARIVARIEAGSHKPATFEAMAADVDENGTIDLNDAYAIRRVAAGEKTFP